MLCVLIRTRSLIYLIQSPLFKSLINKTPLNTLQDIIELRPLLNLISLRPKNAYEMPPIPFVVLLLSKSATKYT
ncbi:hypothetical protein PZA11_008012 [Diplocarpon coronariae]